MDLKTKISSLKINSELKSKLIEHLDDPKKATRIEEVISLYLSSKQKHEAALMKIKSLEHRFSKDVRLEAEKIDRESEENNLSQM